MPNPTDLLRAARDTLLDNRTTPQALGPGFQLPRLGPTFNWAHDWFDAISNDNHGPALIIAQNEEHASTFTFEQMRQRSNRVANWLRTHGLERGDRVIVMLNNQVELWDCMLALMKLGAVIVPTTPAIPPSELAERVRRANVKAAICNPSETAKFDECKSLTVKACTRHVPGWLSLLDAAGTTEEPLAHPQTDAADPLLLYFTSGTTNQPKLVQHTQTSYPVGHLTTLYWMGLRPGDIHLNISSPGWAKHAWSSFFAPWLAQATIFVYNYVRFDPPQLLKVLQRHDVTSMCAPPTVWRMLIQADLGDRPSQLRELLSAGEPLNPEVIQKVVDAWGLSIRDGYGQTEMTAAIGNTPGSRLKLGSMGRALPGVPVVLLDTISGMPSTAEGEICIALADHPVNVMTGYLDDERRTSEAMCGGYYRTGDVASMDADGYITYIGRTDDVFKSSDYKISPFELESALLEHPAVAEAAVVPAPDEVRLTVPKAYVTLATGFAPTGETALDLLRFARSRLAPFQRVRRIEFGELPKTISGKIRRVELRQREVDRQGARSGEWRDDDFEELTPR